MFNGMAIAKVQMKPECMQVTLEQTEAHQVGRQTMQTICMNRHPYVMEIVVQTVTLEITLDLVLQYQFLNQTSEPTS